MSDFTEMVASSIRAKNSIVCCGLDPDINRVPIALASGKSSEDAIGEFLKIVVELAAPYVAAFKIQKAFFDLLPSGHRLLASTISMIRELDSSLPVIVDCKIGDIENTMAAYCEYLFEVCRADAIVLNPYMGSDVWINLGRYPGREGLVLVRTSNSAAAAVQDSLLQSGEPLWRHVLRIVVQAADQFQLVPILSDHGSNELFNVRSLIPDNMLIFLAGIGAQGRTYESIPYLLNSRRAGLLVNSSRALLYPYARLDQNWKSKISHAVGAFREQLNEARV